MLSGCPNRFFVCTFLPKKLWNWLKKNVKFLSSQDEDSDLKKVSLLFKSVLTVFNISLHLLARYILIII